jgi:N-acetylneuraminic acid mutarotase
VLAVGGLAPGRRLASVERYDPATDAWTAVGSLAPGRFAHAAVALADGTVLVAGGVSATERLVDAARCCPP